MSKKILLVDDHPILRHGLKTFIETGSSYIISGQASKAGDAIDILIKEKPDICIVDISLEGETSGLDLVKTIKNRFPGLPCLILSMHDEAMFAERAMRAGAKGYIMKKEVQEVILKALDKILNGGIYLSEKISDKIIASLVHGAKSEMTDPIDLLTNKEFEVFQLIGQGFNSKDIAQKMALSKNTVESHKRHIKEKLNLKKSAELNRFAVQWSMNRQI